MSIFEGLSPGNLKIAWQAARSSPEAMVAVLMMCVAMIAAIAFAAGMISHHVGAFTSRISEEDEAMREELDALEREQNEERGENDAPQKGT